ncbi:uncharacterized protein EI90DRAFT_3029924 [Cantharellus anzutake]|uniref:uncharacterized protein n=1 Tax=Cantharellus anzutake TaxID=1750568 RepID=UPI00190903AE|nr:uncharacterized protein EI90DRAFT_3029924 [Cantharellus anzutake]KAF8342694.1 hypothetical protein EI90DRAFT_3029924 [Cantharellus anzutake]
MVAFFHFAPVLLPLAATFFSVFAQTIPSCAQNCAVKALSGSNCTSLTDLTCVCNNEKFFDSAGVCTLENCNATDVALAAAAQKQLCTNFATTTFSLPPSLTSTISLPTSKPGNSTLSGSATSTHNVNVTSTTSPGTGSGSSTTASAHSTSRSGAAAPGAKVLFGSDLVLALVLGGVMFGAYAIGL